MEKSLDLKVSTVLAELRKKFKIPYVIHGFPRDESYDEVERSSQSSKEEPTYEMFLKMPKVTQQRMLREEVAEYLTSQREAIAFAEGYSSASNFKIRKFNVLSYCAIVPDSKISGVWDYRDWFTEVIPILKAISKENGLDYHLDAQPSVSDPGPGSERWQTGVNLGQVNLTRAFARMTKGRWEDASVSGAWNAPGLTLQERLNIRFFPSPISVSTKKYPYWAKVLWLGSGGREIPENWSRDVNVCWAYNSPFRYQ